jgi:hypothetical protein
MDVLQVEKVPIVSVWILPSGAHSTLFLDFTFGYSIGCFFDFFIFYIAFLGSVPLDGSYHFYSHSTTNPSLGFSCVGRPYSCNT